MTGSSATSTTPNSVWGLWLMGAINIALFGLVPGMLILLTQIVWIPFWAAGVINGIGHWFGYRSYDVADASTNIVPWGILIGGEELHNNHHAFAASAKLSSKWYEFDIGWMYICILESLGLATVKRLAPKPRFAQPKAAADLDTLHAVIANRYDVLSRYAKSFRKTYAQELERLRHWSPRDAEVLRSLKRALLRGQALAGARARAPRRGAEEVARARHRARHAPRARGAVGALERFQGAAAAPVAGLVPSRRSERHRAAGRFLATPALLRLASKSFAHVACPDSGALTRRCTPFPVSVRRQKDGRVPDMQAENRRLASASTQLSNGAS